MVTDSEGISGIGRPKSRAPYPYVAGNGYSTAQKTFLVVGFLIISFLSILLAAY